MVLGLLAVTPGMASMRTGWTLPWVRRRVIRPRIYDSQVCWWARPA
ncbi:hypothetical protein ABZ379_28195 [Streptomyces canus]